MMARHYGFPVSSITLHFLGGMTAIEGEATKPRQEFMIAVVGPLTSILVGAASLGLWFVPRRLLQMAVGSLAAMNLFVGVLNLVPGLPLDGGRVLKAIVWGTTGNMHRGTIVAGWGRPARGGGRARLAAGHGAAPRHQAALHRLRPRLRRRDLPVVRGDGGDLRPAAAQAPAAGRPRPGAAHPRRPRRPAARRGRPSRQEAQAGSIVTVTGSGHPLGVVSEQALLATPEDRRPWVAVSTVARTLDSGLRLPAAITGRS